MTRPNSTPPARIIVLGNSHVAALKVAWDGMAADHPGIDLDFFAAPGLHFRKFKLLDGLRFGLPAEARGPDEVLDISGRAVIDLASADHVVLAGWLWPMNDLADLMRDFDIDGLREVGAPRALSRAAFDAVCQGFAVRLSPGPEWRNWTRPRLVLLPAPMRSSDCLRSATTRFQAMKALGQDGTGGRDVICSFMDTLAQTLRGIGIDLVAQPPETLLPSGFTDPCYSRGSRSIIDAASKRTDDFTHLNDVFGRLHLSEVLERLGLAERPPQGWRASPGSAAGSRNGRRWLRWLPRPAS